MIFLTVRADNPTLARDPETGDVTLFPTSDESVSVVIPAEKVFRVLGQLRSIVANPDLPTSGEIELRIERLCGHRPQPVRFLGQEGVTMICSLEVRKGKAISAAEGNGLTEDEALFDLWRDLTELAPGDYVIAGARKARWVVDQWVDA